MVNELGTEELKGLNIISIFLVWGKVSRYRSMLTGLKFLFHRKQRFPPLMLPPFYWPRFCLMRKDWAHYPTPWGSPVNPRSLTYTMGKSPGLTLRDDGRLVGVAPVPSSVNHRTELQELTPWDKGWRVGVAPASSLGTIGPASVHRSPVANPETSEGGGTRNMKYKPLHVTAIFLWLFL